MRRRSQVTRAVDAVVIGPYDLSGSFGIPGQIESSQVVESIASVQAICKAGRQAMRDFCGDGGEGEGVCRGRFRSDRCGDGLQRSAGRLQSCARRPPVSVAPNLFDKHGNLPPEPRSSICPEKSSSAEVAVN